MPLDTTTPTSPPAVEICPLDWATMSNEQLLELLFAARKGQAIARSHKRAADLSARIAEATASSQAKEEKNAEARSARVHSDPAVIDKRKDINLMEETLDHRTTEVDVLEFALKLRYRGRFE